MSKNEFEASKDSAVFIGLTDDIEENTAEDNEISADEFEFILSTDSGYYDRNERESVTEETKTAVGESKGVDNKPDKKKKPAKASDTSSKKEKSKPVKEKKTAPARSKKPQSTAGFIITVSLKLLLICAVVATLIALVYKITEPVISENEYRKKEAAITEFFPEKTSFEAIASENADVDELFVVRNDIEVIGYCASVSPSGFGGGIKMMVGVGFGKTVIGVKVIEHSETAGVGTNALSSEYLSRYIGEKGDYIELGTTVDAYAGATVSSKAVNEGINSALSVNDEVFGEDAVQSVAEQKPEGIVSIDEALHGADGYGGFYGWIIDVEHTEQEPEENFSPFEQIYLSKAKNEDGTWKDHGYAAVVTVSDESGWAKIMVGTYYNTQLGVRFLDYEGEAFKTLALDTEYMKNYKMNVADPKPLVYGENIPVHESADTQARLIAEKASEVLAYYGEYLTQVNQAEEVGQ